LSLQEVTAGRKMLIWFPPAAMKTTAPLFLVYGPRVAFSMMMYAVLPILMIQASSPAACISIVSSSISVAGNAGGNSYAGENSGESIGQTADGSIWMSASSGSMTTSGATLKSFSRLIGGSGRDWGGGSSRVTLIGVFQPLSRDLVFEFSGLTGYHAFESYIDYTLTDLTTNTLIEGFHWAEETGLGWTGGQSLPYTAQYMLDLAHQYQLNIYARSYPGDFREGYANLELTIVPETTSTLLAALSFVVITFRRNRKS